MVEGHLGSHSIQKYAYTWVQSNGTTQDNKDHYGRLKKTRILDGHDNVQPDYVDAKVASTLCSGGVCSHIVIDPVCTKEWIVTRIMPNIKDVFGHQVAIWIGRALLWLTFPHIKI